MVKQKDGGHAGAGRLSAIQKTRKKNRHYHDRDRPYLPTTSLVARPALPKSKHKTILEWTENTDKKKKLEIEYTTNKNPNTNFSFVPIGNPELTSLCKELSREQGALVYIVSTTKENGIDLSDHVHRIGYHFRTLIVEQATTMVEGMNLIDLTVQDIPCTGSGNKPDPIPESQEEINKQADAAIRDLYPRIPNTDREMIVRHAFQKGAVFNGKPVVGLQADLSLSRRVQLAVIAHIRHTHTRYDMLLRETSWENARKTVQSLCLDVLVKWRGDEETGRDQLDEVLREIVVLDDSDEEDNESEEESGSVSEEEELESSDGSMEVNPERFNALAIISQKPPPESQPTQLVKVQTNGTSQSAHLNSPDQNQNISSRTRSKCNPNFNPKSNLKSNLKSKPSKKGKKARRNNKRYQAWQEALKRRLEPPSAPKTSFEQNSRANARDMDENHRLIQTRTHGNLDSYRTPFNGDYQIIYAIDGGQGPSRPMAHIHGPSDFNYRENMLMNPQTHNATSLEYRYGYDAHPSLSNTLTSHSGGPQPSLATARRDFPAQDMALPSIEPVMDLTNDSLARINSYGPIRHSQVTYQEGEQRILPNHTNVSYLNSWEPNQPKRRRVVLADDRVHIPASSSTLDGYVPVVPKSRAEQPAITVPSFRHITEARDGRNRHNVPTVTNYRLNYPRYSQHAADTQDQNSFPSMTDFRGSTGTDRERRLIIDDDSPPRMRMVRRVHGPSQPYSGEQHTFKPQLHKSQRVGDLNYSKASRPLRSMQDPFHESNRLIDPNPSVQPVIYTRSPSNYQQGVAQGSSTSLSTFPSQPHPREMNSGLVSYPVLSCAHHENEPRFSSNRNEPVFIGNKSSHQFPQEYLAADNTERVMPLSREENHRSTDLNEVSRMERTYVPIDLQGRSQHVEQHYIPIESQGVVGRVIRQIPLRDSGLNNPTYERRLPHRDEVIILSP